ncbi:MAG TPA: alpha-2-macroglobulin family protein, partial [Candidatus Sulfotelmatobacter sp.]|nr:alpha-2-macroglobulin family protein [Candidatus Sulfotelmatobacter sp.]
ALVTVERDRVLRSFTTALAGNAPTIRVPIEPGDVPNLFVSVTLVRGSLDCPRPIKEPEYRVGYCQLAVKDPQHHLAVTVSSPATNYLPAQPVTLNVAIRDSRGTPVSDAEVTLYAVDEGILSLSGAEVPEPYAFFYAPRPLAVESGISLPNLLEEDPGELRFGNKGYLGGDGGAERLRKNFLACAFWNATLRTDANGQVQAVFPAPDSLTRYRVVAVAHTRESRFGSAQAAFQVAKPLVVEPALPRFANVTDRLQARAVVLNQTARAGEVEVTLQLDDHARSTEPSPALTRRVFVAAHGAAAVEFPLEFVGAGVAQWIWKSRFVNEPPGGFTDAVQSTLPVGYPTPLLREILLAKAQGAEMDLLAQANPQLVAGHGTVTVELANTRLINLSEAISRLLHYPYGCAEQTGSSLLPWIVLQGQSQWRPLLCGGTNDPQRAIRAGVARLFSMQTQSGGLGYWPKDREPMFWASAYGGLVLALAQRHGVELPKEDFDRLLSFLSSQLRSNSLSVSSADDFCLAAYALALAGRAEPAYHEKLFGQREQLSPEGRELLALAINEGKGPREMVNALLTAPVAGAKANEALFGGPARQKAIKLLAFV